MSETIELQEAVGQLAAAFRRRREAGEHASDAFFFVIGAGMSAPQVPLAGEIERRCRETAVTRGVPDALPPGAPDGPMDRYAHWLRKAYPQPTERQEYFRCLIERRPISAANLRLAHLLQSDLVPRLVVTPNFDDFLSRALTLFGRQHVVCDHPATAERIDPERPNDIQILHVHGTYWFYDCVNLTGEIDARAQLEPVHQTIGSRLDRILDRRSPIVIGYSGWENDVLMTALQRRLAARPLGYNLYWFCHSAETADNAPAFLRARGDVYFVVPPGRKPVAAAAGDAKQAQPSAEAPAAPATGGTRLDAVTVLEALIRSLDVDAPPLTQNPIRFLAGQLRESLLVADATDGVADLYGLQPMIERLEALRAHWGADLEPYGEEPRPDAQLERVRDAIRRSQHREALREAVEIPLDGLSATELDELSRTAWLASVSLLDDSEDERAGYRLSVDAADALELADPTLAGELASQVATALVYEAITLSRMGDSERAIEVYDDVVARFGDDPAPALREQVARALVNKGFLQGVRGESEEAVEAYGQVVERFLDDAAPAIREQVATALFNRGYRLGVLGRTEEALDTYEQVVARYGDETEPALREQAGKALFNTGIELGTRGDTEKAIEVYDQVIARFGDDSELALRENVAKAYLNKGLALSARGESDREIEAYEQLVARFGGDPEPALRVNVAKALLNTGLEWSARGESDLEIAAYGRLDARFGDDEDTAVREQVAKGLLNEGIERSRRGEGELAIAAFDQIVARFDDPDPVLREQVARALVNKGSELSSRGERERAVAAYEEIVARFGDDPDPVLATAVADARQGLEGLRGAAEPDPPGD